jgi:hypothetical protein
VIRFSALLVAVATVLLIAGVVTSKLALVYVAIGMSALALAALGAGAGLKRNELFGQAAGASRAGIPVPSESSPSIQPEAASVAASGSTGAGVAAGASSASVAGTRKAAPWESGATGWDSEAASWGIEAPPVKDRTSAQGRGMDTFPASSAWPPAPAASSWSAAPEAGRFGAPDASRFETPEAGRFGAGQPAPDVAAYAPPVRKPEHARPVGREVPAKEPASSTASWSNAFTPPSALADADARLTTAIPVRPAPEGPGSGPQDGSQDDAEDAKTASVDAETTVKLDDGAGVKDAGHPAPGLADEDVTRQLSSGVAESGTSDVDAADAEAADAEAVAELDGETSSGAGVDSSTDVAEDVPADVSDDARATPASATDEGPGALDATERADRTMVLETSAVRSSGFTAGAADTSIEDTSDADLSTADTSDADLSSADTGAVDASGGEDPTSIDSAEPVEPERDASAETGPDSSALDSTASLDGSPEAVADNGTDSAKTPAPDPTREVTIVPGVPRYHDARCILIRFMGEDDLEKTTLAAAVDVGCTPCRACLPEQDPA